MLSINSHPCMIELSSLDGKASGLMIVDGHAAWEAKNPISLQPGTLENGHLYWLLVSARILAPDRASIDVSLDGKPDLPHWEGSPRALEAQNFWTMPSSNGIGFGTSAAATFHSVKLRVVSGHASLDQASLDHVAAAVTVAPMPKPNPRPIGIVEQPAAVTLDDVATEFTWKSDQPVAQRIPTRGGFCCLSSIGGHFDGYATSAGVRPGSAYWSFGGESKKSPLIARAFSLQRLPAAMFKGRVKEYAWRNGDGPIKMLQKVAGICVLSGVTGRFAGPGEDIRVRLDDDGYWYLEGKSGQKELVNCDRHRVGYAEKIYSRDRRVRLEAWRPFPGPNYEEESGTRFPIRSLGQVRRNRRRGSSVAVGRRRLVPCRQWTDEGQGDRGSHIPVGHAAWRDKHALEVRIGQKDGIHFEQSRGTK